MTRVAMLSLHTSPLGRLGVGDGGGMNVYVRELSIALAGMGVEIEVYTVGHGNSRTVQVVPGLRVHHLDVQAAGLAKDELTAISGRFADQVAADAIAGPGIDLIHAHYWLSGLAGHDLKHRLGLPLVSTFHTLSRVKQQAGIASDPPARTLAEEQIIGCSDAIVASSDIERQELLELYDARPDRVHVVTPGVDHRQFSPGDRSAARRLLGLPQDEPIVLYVGRIQPVKGLDRAIDVFDRLIRTHPRARLVVVGGPSGPDGDRTLADARRKAAEGQLPVSFVGPKGRTVLPAYYRAADVCLVPSRSEASGLVALEAASCGIPVVASAVGGLRFVVENDRTGYLVPRTDVAGFASRIGALLDSPSLRTSMGAAARARAMTMTWNRSARQLSAVYAQLQSGLPALCLAH